MSLLAERLLAVHEALQRAQLPHAFGGAIALAYCTEEPRGTRDLDVNVFAGPERSDEVLDAMPPGVEVRQADRTALVRDGQVRVMWGDTPIDLFLDTHEYHREVAATMVEVPFEGTTIPTLGCEALIVFKAMFNRTKDWADIEAVLEVGIVDGPRVLGKLRSLLGREDPSVVRLAALLSN